MSRYLPEGVLNGLQREEVPVGSAIHESTAISTIWPAMRCFDDLVLFDPMKVGRTSMGHKWADCSIDPAATVG